MNKTYSAKPAEQKRKWYVVDASQYPLGRLATKVANVLRGKHKPIFTSHVDTGDYVVVINASKVKVTGKKAETMVYKHYSGYPGGLKIETFKTVLGKNPEKIIIMAVKRMLPDNRLSAQIIKKLKVYPGVEHKNEAQKPETLKF
ncbi:MAG: 50S ribosomal protein L13 [Candidatus Ancaeobacter aquaticus]|nr:50S ribosomal protein L13 [Candidatus Ancaeobacter aquaticus]